MLSEVDFRHALLDPHVAKQRVKLYGSGVYVDVASLAGALDERGCHLEAGELDRYVGTLGGHRVERSKWLARMIPSRRSKRPARYFLPEVAFQRIRQRR
jgi:hypothetical protein